MIICIVMGNRCVVLILWGFVLLVSCEFIALWCFNVLRFGVVYLFAA